jgi:hypothetical protein
MGVQMGGVGRGFYSQPLASNSKRNVLRILFEGLIIFKVVY